MEQCNGTNLEPIPPIIFFNKRMKIGDVLVLSWDRWRERLRSGTTAPGVKVLKTVCRIAVMYSCNWAVDSRYSCNWAVDSRYSCNWAVDSRYSCNWAVDSHLTVQIRT
jgi:hypothetical protein